MLLWKQWAGLSLEEFQRLPARHSLQVRFTTDPLLSFYVWTQTSMETTQKQTDFLAGLGRYETDGTAAVFCECMKEGNSYT